MTNHSLQVLAIMSLLHAIFATIVPEEKEEEVRCSYIKTIDAITRIGGEYHVYFRDQKITMSPYLHDGIPLADAPAVSFAHSIITDNVNSDEGEYIFNIRHRGLGVAPGYCLRTTSDRMECLRYDDQDFAFPGLVGIPNFKLQEVKAIDHYGDGYLAVLYGLEANKTQRSVAVLLDKDRKYVKHEFYNHMAKVPTCLAQKSVREMYVFFGPFWQERQVSDTNIALTIQPSALYRMSLSWTSCPQSLCFDSQLDAIGEYDAKTLFFRGHYAHEVNGRLQTGIKVSAVPKIFGLFGITGALDAAFGEFSGKKMTLFQGNFLSVFSDGKLVLEESIRIRYPGFQGTAVDAVFVEFATNIAYIFHGEQLEIFTPLQDNSGYVRSKAVKMREYYRGMASHIDAAHMDTSGTLGTVYLFSGNFVYTQKRAGERVYPFLAAQGFFDCRSSNYTEIEADTYLGIRSAADFKVYAEKHREMDDFVTTTTAVVDTLSTSTTNSTLADPEQAVLNNVDTIIIAVAAAVIIGLVIFVVVWLIRRNRIEDEPLEFSSVSTTGGNKKTADIFETTVAIPKPQPKAEPKPTSEAKPKALPKTKIQAKAASKAVKSKAPKLLKK